MTERDLQAARDAFKRLGPEHETAMLIGVSLIREIERLREALDGIERRTKHADLPICKDINERARSALRQP